MSKHKIWKGGRLIATASSARTASFGWEGRHLYCLFFPALTMDPPVVFEHLAGTALSKYLHGSMVACEEKDLLVFPMGYVHGRSEVMRGQPKISSVLLIKTAEMPTLLELTEGSAEIYQKFLEVVKDPV